MQLLLSRVDRNVLNGERYAGKVCGKSWGGGEEDCLEKRFLTKNDFWKIKKRISSKSHTPKKTFLIPNLVG